MSDADFEIYDDDEVVSVKIGLDPGEIPDNAIISFHTPTDLVYVMARDGCDHEGGGHGATAFLSHLLVYLANDDEVLNDFKVDIIVKERG